MAPTPAPTAPDALTLTSSSASAPDAARFADPEAGRPPGRRAGPFLRVAAALIAAVILGSCGIDREPARPAVLDGFGASAPERGDRGERSDLEAGAEAVARSVIARGRRELSLLVTIDQAPRRIWASATSGSPSGAALQPPLAADLAATIARGQRDAIAEGRLSLRSGEEPGVQIQALHRHPGEPVVAVVCLTVGEVTVQATDGSRSSTAYTAQQVMALRPSTPTERSGPGWTVVGFDVAWESGTDDTCPSPPSEEELCGCDHEGTRPEDQGPAAAAARWSASSARETRALRPLVEGSR